MSNHNLILLWQEGRTRLTNQLAGIKSEDLTKKLGDSPNSAGFLIRHLAEVELLFAKNIFGNAEAKVDARTLKAGKDTGEWTDLEALLAIVEEAGIQLQKAIDGQSGWEAVIETKEFGKKTKMEALGRITTHTAYHAGQLAIIVKYGQ
ncbi:MAG TPA: DinB family protein [Lunatimonas sp.]|nr:DinB family protein [Lunatimonas sp.]